MAGLETTQKQEDERQRLWSIAYALLYLTRIKYLCLSDLLLSSYRKYLHDQGGEMIPGFVFDDGIPKETFIKVPVTADQRTRLRRPSVLEGATEFIARKLNRDRPDGSSRRHRRAFSGS